MERKKQNLKVNLPRLLRKIELYCILHNVDNWDDVPYHCESCFNRNGIICNIKQSEKGEIIKFINDGNFKNFKKGTGDEEFRSSYTGCLKWKEKEKI